MEGAMEGIRRRTKDCQEWEPTEEAVQIVKTSKMEGLKDAFKPNLPLRTRLFWLGAFLLCTVVAIVLSNQSIDDFIHKPILFTFNGSISIANVPFPGVTAMSLSLIPYSLIDEALELHDNVRFEPKTTLKNGQEWNETEVYKLVYFLYNICEHGINFSYKLFAKLAANQRITPSDLHWLVRYILTKINVTINDAPSDLTYSDKIIPLIKQDLINCSKVFAACSWKDVVQDNCQDMFYPTQTDVGYGCSFNRVPDNVLRGNQGLQAMINTRGLKPDNLSVENWKHWSIDNHSFFGRDNNGVKIDRTSVPYEQSIAGHPFGLSFLIVYDNSDLAEDVPCPMSDGKGYMIALHAPHEEPQIKLSGLVIPPNHEVFVEVKAEVTISDSSIRRIPRDTRQCYFQNENPLNTFTKYTASNCMTECLAGKILEKCECRHLSVTHGEGEVICGPPQKDCIRNVTNRINHEGYENVCVNPKCYPPCNHVEYEAKMTSIPYRNYNLHKIKRLMHMNDNQTTSIVHVFFSSHSMVSRERKLRYEWSEFFGILGGIWGLMLGISTMRLVNVFASLSMLTSSILQRIPILKRIWRDPDIVETYPMDITSVRDTLEQTTDSNRLETSLNTSSTVTSSQTPVENYSDNGDRESLQSVDAVFVIIPRRNSISM